MSTYLLFLLASFFLPAVLSYSCELSKCAAVSVLDDPKRSKLCGLACSGYSCRSYEGKLAVNATCTKAPCSFLDCCVPDPLFEKMCVPEAECYDDACPLTYCSMCERDPRILRFKMFPVALAYFLSGFDVFSSTWQSLGKFEGFDLPKQAMFARDPKVFLTDVRLDALDFNKFTENESSGDNFSGKLEKLQDEVSEELANYNQGFPSGCDDTPYGSPLYQSIVQKIKSFDDIKCELGGKFTTTKANFFRYSFTSDFMNITALLAPFAPAFASAILALPTSSRDPVDAAPFLAFTEKFGTSYVEDMKIGGYRMELTFWFENCAAGVTAPKDVRMELDMSVPCMAANADKEGCVFDPNGFKAVSISARPMGEMLRKVAECVKCYETGDFLYHEECHVWLGSAGGPWLDVAGKPKTTSDTLQFQAKQLDAVLRDKCSAWPKYKDTPTWDSLRAHGNVFKPPAEEVPAEEVETGKDILPVVLISAGAFVFLVCVFLVWWCCCRQKRESSAGAAAPYVNLDINY